MEEIKEVGPYDSRIGVCTKEQAINVMNLYNDCQTYLALPNYKV